MNTQVSKVLLIVVLSAILGVSAGAAVGTFTFKTTGASDTVEAVDLVYPQRVPEANSVSTSSIADGSVTPAKLSGPIPVANGGTGKTTAAEGLAALGGASLNGSSTVNFNSGAGSKVSMPPWIEAVYENGWTTSAGYATASYYIDCNNIVHLRGAIKGGTSVAFTLPEGYRPAYYCFFMCDDNGLPKFVLVRPDGFVMPESNGRVSLNGIQFRIDQ